MISYFVNYGVGIYQTNSPNIWRVPFGFQLVPAGIMLLGLFTVKVRTFLLCRNKVRAQHFIGIASLARIRRTQRRSSRKPCLSPERACDITVRPRRICRDRSDYRGGAQSKERPGLEASLFRKGQLHSIRHCLCHFYASTVEWAELCRVSDYHA